MNTNGSRRWRSSLAATLLASALLVTAGCGDSGGGGGGPPLAPTITSFTAASSPVTTGTGATLTAVFSGGTGSVSNGVGPITSGVPVSTGNLGTSTTFLLTVTNTAGATATSTLTVNVVPAPEITEFSVSKNPVTTGQPTTLSYSFTGGTGSIDQNIGNVTSGGTRVVQPTTTTTYTLTVTNAAGTAVTRVLTVGVLGVPRITSFTANPTTVAPGEAATLTAVFENGIGSVDQGIGTITSGVGVGTGAMATTATYRLTVTNAALDSVAADVTVVVTRFRATGSLAVPRTDHTATLLQDGRVLVAGGDALGSAELYDPATGAFVTTGSMGVARRWGHAAARLADGRVLVTGGLSNNVEASAELYDPATGSFTPTGPMLHPRFNHTATTLPDGNVLIAGGCCVINAIGQYVDDEIYDPATGTFADASPRVPSTAVFEHAAIGLTTGDVLIAGGWGGAEISSITATATVRETASGLFGQVGSMQYRRQQPSAALLSDGRVLVVGLTHGTADFEREAELYDPVTATFALTAETQMVDARSATALPDGTVLVTGNVSLVAPVTAGSAERYDPGTGAFEAEGPMRFPRKDGYTATRLLTGEVLFVGGTADDVTPTSSAELFR
jgi:hypothetical protein